MREYDVTVCSEECGRYMVITLILDDMWTCAQTGWLENTQGDDPSYCSHCDTKFGIDERGPWRERMVPRSALEWLAREIADICVCCGEDAEAQTWFDAALIAAEEDDDE